MSNSNNEVIIVANDLGDWEDLSNFIFIRVDKETRELMSEEHRKWWHYFDDAGGHETLGRQDATSLLNHYEVLIEENNEMRAILNEHGLLCDEEVS